MINSMASGGNYYSTTMSGMPKPPDPSQMAKDLLSSADTDGNGSISESEFSSLLGSTSNADSSTISGLFSKLDTNGDGSLSSQEVSKAVSSMVDQMRGEVMRGGSMPPPPPPGGGQPPSAADFLSKADSNGDGSLDQSEFTAALQGMGGQNSSNDTSRIAQMFKDADTNGDGKLSASELKAAMQNHQPPMGPPPGSEASSSQTTNGTTSSSNDQISFLVNSLLSQYQQNQSQSETTSQLSLSA